MDETTNIFKFQGQKLNLDKFKKKKNTVAFFKTIQTPLKHISICHISYNSNITVFVFKKKKKIMVYTNCFFF